MSNLSAASGTWVIDPTHTNLGFSARHAMVAKVRGNFGEFSGSFTIDGDNLAASTAEVTIQVASIDTKTADRDTHLKSPDFLDVENFPTITFVSTAVTPKGDDVVITGDLTIHGVTKEVTFEVEAKVDGGTIRVATADPVPVALADYDIEKPTGGPVAEIADDGSFEFLVVLAQS